MVQQAKDGNAGWMPAVVKVRVTTWASFYIPAGPGEPDYTDHPSLAATCPRQPSRQWMGI